MDNQDLIERLGPVDKIVLFRDCDDDQPNGDFRHSFVIAQAAIDEATALRGHGEAAYVAYDNTQGEDGEYHVFVLE